MFDINDLRGIIMLNYLTDAMLEKLKKIATIKEFMATEYIFKEGEYAEYLYSLIEGQVGLETAKNNTSFLVTQIVRGQTFGYSSLLDTEHRKYLGHARALTDVKAFAWRGTDIEKLLVEDYEMGFLLMRRIANIIDKRLQVAKAQLVALHR